MIKGRVTEQIDYLTADEEDRQVIAQANAPLTANGDFPEDRVLVRSKGGEIEYVPGEAVDYMDVSPRQMVSVATAMIPFLEHDDANRALMGSNMQRQAVPLVKAEAPLVGTGMEWRAAVDAGDVVVATSRRGHRGVSRTPSRRERRRHHRHLPLANFCPLQPGHQATTQSVLVDHRRPRRGSTRCSRTAAGHGRGGKGRARPQPAGGVHVLEGSYVTRMRDRTCPLARCAGTTFLSSIHIEEHEVDARDTGLRPWRRSDVDIPTVSEEVLAVLDERGMIRIGAQARAGDILVGKVTPKGETELTPEERTCSA